MTTSGQQAFIEHLRTHLVGPTGGEDETVTANPVYAYLTGMLFPVEVGEGLPPETLEEELAPEEAEAPLSVDPAFRGEEGPDDDDDDIGNLTAASSWTPSSMGLSFVHDAPELVLTARAARYERRTADQTGGETDGAWQRISLAEQSVIIASGSSGQEDLWGGLARFQWRSRPGKQHPIVTVALSNATTTGLGRAKQEIAQVLFQTSFEVNAVGGVVLPYPGDVVVNATPEDRELEYRYRNELSYAIGHGVSATWSDDVPVTTVSTDSLPTQIVRKVKPREAAGKTLQMGWLADPNVPARDLKEALHGFLADYETWVADRRSEAGTAGERHVAVAHGIVARMDRAVARIREGIDLLGSDDLVLRSFRLANHAMRLQSTRGRDSAIEPAWRPFQLAFLLLSLASTADEKHDDRELVDLIWFPTGGGKTEAYLGLAAFELIRRRLARGFDGGGTAVITRYTMRLLTAQQFQRAARLICALELMRKTSVVAGNVPAFSIGLLLGNSTTPGTYKQAVKQLKEVRNQQSPQNPFQIRTCPWCDTHLLPERKSARDELYGFQATPATFRINCVNPACDFNDSLPMQVVDEAIYQDPPSIVVATVDKFARLAWIEDGGSLFGLAGAPFDPPSLVIQDELHLISGPLGTIVGIYEAAIRALLKWRRTTPKLVASTATIRSADEQVRGLMASQVEVFPPSGLDADDSYFAQLDSVSPGRAYIGILPQAFAPAWAIGQAAGRLLSAPEAITTLTPQERDAYWTLVLYHNSLRELGRSVTILRDDVRTLLEREAQGDIPHRRTIGTDGIEELTSNVSSHALVELLERLDTSVDEPGVIDAIAATNILSVGIDVDRLGLMLVNGQPKTTAEYIQATSRVGRSAVPGIVMTLYRSSKARDRSTFEAFRAFHGSFYRFVEPTSVTPWAHQARRRALRAALVIVIRHAVGLNANAAAASFDDSSAMARKAVDLILHHVRVADPREADAVESELRAAASDWAGRAAASGLTLKYEDSAAPARRLLKTFGDSDVGWPTMHSMRSVEQGVRIRPRGEKA